MINKISSADKSTNFAATMVLSRSLHPGNSIGYGYFVERAKLANILDSFSFTTKNKKGFIYISDSTSERGFVRNHDPNYKLNVFYQNGEYSDSCRIPANSFFRMFGSRVDERGLLDTAIELFNKFVERERRLKPVLTKLNNVALEQSEMGSAEFAKPNLKHLDFSVHSLEDAVLSSKKMQRDLATQEQILGNFKYTVPDDFSSFNPAVEKIKPYAVTKETYRTKTDNTVSMSNIDIFSKSKTKEGRRELGKVDKTLAHNSRLVFNAVRNAADEEIFNLSKRNHS